MKQLLTLLLMVSFFGAKSQQLASIDTNVDSQANMSIDSNDTVIEAQKEIRYVDYLAFDTSLIPCSDLYDYSWDSLNLDQPKVEPGDSNVAVTLALIESSCNYHHPCEGPITSDFGWRRYRMHKGVDIDLETGDAVYAAFDGVIRIAKYNYGGFGNYIVIRHYNGLETLYGHLSDRFVVPNQTVTAGQIIGLGGNTGRSTGSHLHFEVLYRGCQINPNKIISFSDTANHLKVDSVYLCIDDFKYTAKSASGAPNPNGVIYYRVRSGDSLWKISRRYGTSVDRICRLNGINRTATLRIGKSLRIR